MKIKKQNIQIVNLSYGRFVYACSINRQVWIIRINNKFFPTGATTHCGFVFYSPLAGYSLPAYEVSWSHTTRHNRKESSGRVISPSQRPLPDNTQHSQQTNIHALGGIRTHNLSRRAAVHLRLRPRGHWDPQRDIWYTKTHTIAHCSVQKASQHTAKGL